MQPRVLLIVGLLALPCGLNGQILRLPRRGSTPTPAQPAKLPPEAAPVARDLVLKRSRWSAEAYSFVSSVSVPASVGTASRYTTYSTGTHGDYRYTDRWAMTVDLTASPFGGGALTKTGELGTRFRPLSPDAYLHPFFDVRGAYMTMYDMVSLSEGAIVGGGPDQVVTDGRYSRGVGGIMGAGLEYSLTRQLALTTELAAMRSRMTAYDWTGPASVPGGTRYWMTSLRYIIGFRYNPVRAMKAVQKATP